HRIDIAEWNTIVDEFSTPLHSEAPQGQTVRRELFPPLQRVRLQADSMALYGLQLDAATLTAQRERPLRWRMDIASARPAGTVYWNQADAATTGRVDARFDRLALGEDKAGGEQRAQSDSPDAVREAGAEDGG